MDFTAPEIQPLRTGRWSYKTTRELTAKLYNYELGLESSQRFAASHKCVYSCSLWCDFSVSRVCYHCYRHIYTNEENHCLLYTLRPRQIGRHFADDVFRCIFLNENVWIPTFGNRCLSAIGGGKQWSRLAGWVQLSAEAASGPHGEPPSPPGGWEYRWCGKFTWIAAL